MKQGWLVLFCVLSVPLFAQSSNPASSPKASDLMIVGVAHDDSVMGGGIGGSHFLPPGKVAVQPVAWLTPDGNWKKISCDEGHLNECRKFDRESLSKPHTYTVISADGNGAVVHLDRLSLDKECFGIDGDGTFSGSKVHYAAIAASSAEVFTSGEPARRLSDRDAEPVRKALAAAVGVKLDSTKELRVYSIQLEGQSLLVIQRAYQDYASKPNCNPDVTPNFEFILAIGAMREGRFHLLHWKEDTSDDNEQILGLIRLKSGRDFLVDASSDPESNVFRVYGIRDGKLTLIFQGGGGSC